MCVRVLERERGGGLEVYKCERECLFAGKNVVSCMTWCSFPRERKGLRQYSTRTKENTRWSELEGGGE